MTEETRDPSDLLAEVLHGLDRACKQMKQERETNNLIEQARLDGIRRGIEAAAKRAFDSLYPPAPEDEWSQHDRVKAALGQQTRANIRALDPNTIAGEG